MAANEAHDSRDAGPADDEYGPAADEYAPAEPMTVRASAVAAPNDTSMDPRAPDVPVGLPWGEESRAQARAGRGASTDPPAVGAYEYLTTFALVERLAEEINRAGRHGTALSCVLVAIENVHALEGIPGGAKLAERTWAYVGLALRQELRRFDRVGRPWEGGLLIVLPGADGPRAEIVARRLLARLRTIKLEIDGRRRPLRVAVGLAMWRQGMDAESLLEHAHAAVGRESAKMSQ